MTGEIPELLYAGDRLGLLGFCFVYAWIGTPPPTPRKEAILRAWQHWESFPSDADALVSAGVGRAGSEHPRTGFASAAVSGA